MTLSLRTLLGALALLVAACSPLSKAQPGDVETQGKAPAIALKGRVTDAAGLLGPQEREHLADMLQGFEQATSHQMVVVTVPSLNGQDVKTFTTELGNAWGIGRKGHDDGVLVLLAPNEREARIGVGYGLEETLPDDFCQQVMDELMVPRFQKGDWAKGVEAGVTALARRIGHDVQALPLPDPARAHPRAELHRAS